MARGRPRGSKNKPKTDGEQPDGEAPEGQGAGLGHNSREPLTDEERIALAFHWKKKVVAGEAKKKEGTRESADAFKRAEREGIAKDVLKQLVALDTDEGRAKVQAEVAARMLARRWSGLDEGAQDDLFAADRTPLIDKARAAGKVAAMNGEDCVAPHEPGNELGQAWIGGCQYGQAIMVSMLKKLEAPAPILDHAEAFPQEGQPEGEELPERGDGIDDEPGPTDDASIDSDVPEIPAPTSEPLYSEQWKAANGKASAEPDF